MQHAFWHERWTNNQIGFHLDQANPLLVKHINQLALTPGQRVFVPLCGKSLDMHWLLQHGYHVVGAELSTLAVEALFASLKRTPTIRTSGALTHYSSEQIDVFNGDFFALEAAQLGQVDAVYDRAALVALPADMRGRYTQHLVDITQHAPQLLVSFDYDQSAQPGPPFSVNAQELHQHYGKDYTLQLLEDAPLADGLKGKCPAQEQVWLLRALSTTTKTS